MFPRRRGRQPATDFSFVPTSRATRVTSEAKALSWSTNRIDRVFEFEVSPFTSTLIFFDKSPFATAVVTSAMYGPDRFKLRPIWFHAVGQVFQVPATPSRLPDAQLPSEPTSRATRVTPMRKALSWSTIVLIVSLVREFSFTSTVIFFDKSR